jgi:hypothetical protein
MLHLDNLNPEIINEEICSYLDDSDLFSLSCANHTCEQLIEPVFKKRYALFENPEEIYIKDLIGYAKLLPKTIQTLHTIAKYDAVNIFKYLYISNTKEICDYLFCACDHGSYRIVSCILEQYEFSCDAISSILEKFLELPLDSKVEKVIQTIINAKQEYDIDIDKYDKNISKLDLDICRKLVSNNKSVSSSDVFITTSSIRNAIIRKILDKGTFQIDGITAINQLYTYMPNQTQTAKPLTMCDICSMLFLIFLHSEVNNNLYLAMIVWHYLYTNEFERCFSPEIFIKLLIINKHFWKYIISFIATITCLLCLQLSSTYLPLLVSSYLILSNLFVVVFFTTAARLLFGVNLNASYITRLNNLRVHPYILSFSSLCYKMTKYLYPSIMMLTCYVLFCLTNYGQAIVYTLFCHREMSFRFKCMFVILSLIMLSILPSHLVVVGYVCLSELYLKTTKFSTVDISILIIITVLYHVDINIALSLTAARILFNNMSYQKSKNLQVTLLNIITKPQKSL